MQKVQSHSQERSQKNNCKLHWLKPVNWFCSLTFIAWYWILYNSTITPNSPVTMLIFCSSKIWDKFAYDWKSNWLDNLKSDREGERIVHDKKIEKTLLYIEKQIAAPQAGRQKNLARQKLPPLNVSNSPSMRYSKHTIWTCLTTT